MRRLMITAMFLFALGAQAGDKIDKTLEVIRPGVVEIHNVRGNVQVHGWDEAKVKVAGELDDLAEQFVFTSEGEKTLIEVKLPRDSNYRSRKGSNLIINMPRQSRLDFSGVATDLVISKVDGGLIVNSVSGDIKVSETKGKNYINSVSGELDLVNIDGSLEVSTVSGGVNADVNCPQMKLRGVSGPLLVKSKVIESVSISNVSGESRVSGKMSDSGEIKMSSVSGQAFYFIENDELDAKVTIETAPGGGITNEYSEDQPRSSFINASDLHFVAGSGKGKIQMFTVSGEIGIKRKEKSNGEK